MPLQNQEKMVFEKEDFPIRVSFLPSVDSTSSLWHEEIELKCVLSGQVQMMIDTEIVTAGAGDIIFINPHQIHSNVTLGEEGSYQLIILGLDLFAPTDTLDLRRLFLEEGMQIKNLVQNSMAFSIAERLIKEYESHQPYSQLAMEGLAKELFAVLLRQEQDKGALRGSLKGHIKFYKTIEPAVVKLRECFDESFSGDELAGFCKLNRHYFCRIFKQAMGVTPIQYQNACRLKMADIFMKDMKLSISEIAHRVGFEDEAYFSRAYKKYRGISPKQAKSTLSK